MYAVAGLVASLSLLQDALHNQFSGLIVLLFCVFAWIGVQHLGYSEFAIARQLFLKGTFRRIIDSQTRLRQLEHSLASTTDLDQWWKAMISGSKTLGLDGVQMRIAGGVFENHKPDTSAASMWQLRIPLSSHEYITFEHLQNSEVNPVLIATFVEVIRRTLHDRTAKHEDTLIPITSGSDLPTVPNYLAAPLTRRAGGHS